ncbi:hypothetical protein JHK82_041663 [Glycine max]|nr:hypothetical protein JHK82_041663 [Glycine max]
MTRKTRKLRIVDRVVSKFERVEGIDLSKDKEALVCITKEARNAIRNLSFLTCAPISKWK